MKLINPILITLNNTLHIKADNLEPVEVDSSCVDGILLSIDHKIPQFSLSEGINISELSDRIEVRKIYVHKRESLNNFVYRAFLIPEKEEGFMYKGIFVLDEHGNIAKPVKEEVKEMYVNVIKIGEDKVTSRVYNSLEAAKIWVKSYNHVGTFKLVEVN